MHKPGFKSLCRRMISTGREDGLERRIFHKQQNGSYVNSVGTVYTPPRGQRALRETIVLNQQLTAPATPGAAKQFRRLYRLQTLARTILGLDRYNEVSSKLMRGCVLAELLQAYNPGALPAQDPCVISAMQQVWHQTRSSNGLKTVAFQYCSRNAQGVVPLRSLLDSNLIAYSNYYTVTTIDPEAMKDRLQDVLGEKGLVRVLRGHKT